TEDRSPLLASPISSSPLLSSLLFLSSYHFPLLPPLLYSSHLPPILSPPLLLSCPPPPSSPRLISPPSHSLSSSPLSFSRPLLLSSLLLSVSSSSPSLIPSYPTLHFRSAQ